MTEAQTSLLIGAVVALITALTALVTALARDAAARNRDRENFEAHMRHEHGREKPPSSHPDDYSD